MYPKNDDEHRDLEIVEVSEDSMKTSDGWSFAIQDDWPIKPRVGMNARFYGAGIGSRVRGLFLDGVEAFYRTPDEDKDRNEIELYGESAQDWLDRWDEGRSVWSIEMGGLGPGYEQCIHVTAAELLRHMLAEGYDANAWSDADTWSGDRDKIDTYSHANETINALGLSGAQYGAALNLAAMLYRRGPRHVLNDERVKDRHIQVSKNFPAAA